MCKHDCEGKCRPIDPVVSTDETAMENDEFHLKMAEFPILFMLCRFGGKPIENANEIRERANNFHQKMMGIIDDLEGRMDELKKEADGNAV